MKRRDFLKLTGAGAVGMAVAPATIGAVVKEAVVRLPEFVGVDFGPDGRLIHTMLMNGVNLYVTQERRGQNYHETYAPNDADDWTYNVYIGSAS